MENEDPNGDPQDLLIHTFDPVIEVENDFFTARVSFLELTSELARNSDFYRDLLTSLITKLTNIMNQTLNQRYRKTPWPLALVKSRSEEELRKHTQDIILSEWKRLLKGYLTISPEGFKFAVDNFCTANIREKIRTVLQSSVMARLFDAGALVQTDANGLNLRIDRMSKAQIKVLRQQYLEHYPVDGLFRVYCHTTQPKEPREAHPTEVCCSIATDYVEGEGSFYFRIGFTMNQVTAPQSLRAIATNRLADMFYTKFNESKVDQIPFITMKSLEIPETLVPEVRTAYCDMYDKAADFYDFLETESDDD